jgi:hypothetical protein
MVLFESIMLLSIGIFAPLYEIQALGCSANSLNSSPLYVYSYGVCGVSSSIASNNCLYFSENSPAWAALDLQNLKSGYESSFATGATDWQQASLLSSLGLFSVFVYVFCFLIMYLKPKLETYCMILQAFCLLLSFGLYISSLYKESITSQLNALAWQTSYFQSCTVSIQPSYGYNSIGFILITEGILTIAYILTCTSWYCYACGCFHFFVSTFKFIAEKCGLALTPFSGSTNNEESSLLTKGSGNVEITTIDMTAYRNRSKKKVLILMSDTGFLLETFTIDLLS